MKRVLIVGASGFLGANLCVRLRQKYRVFGTYYRHHTRVDQVPQFHLPLSPEFPIAEKVAALRPDCVVYCAAERDERICKINPRAAMFLNADAAALVAETIAAWDGRFIYLSSSKVFSGKGGNYGEEVPPDPNSVYGQTKRTGEELLARWENVFTLRLGTLYGVGGFNQQTVLSHILESLWNKKPLDFVADEYRSFVSVEDVARFIEACLEAPTDLAGTYHVGRKKKESHFQFAEKVAQVFSLPKDLLRPVPGASFQGGGFTPEERGKDLSLSGVLFQKIFSLEPLETEPALKKIRHRLQLGRQ